MPAALGRNGMVNVLWSHWWRLLQRNSWKGRRATKPIDGGHRGHKAALRLKTNCCKPTCITTRCAPSWRHHAGNRIELPKVIGKGVSDVFFPGLRVGQLVPSTTEGGGIRTRRGHVAQGQRDAGIAGPRRQEHGDGDRRIRLGGWGVTQVALFALRFPAPHKQGKSPRAIGGPSTTQRGCGG